MHKSCVSFPPHQCFLLERTALDPAFRKQLGGNVSLLNTLLCHRPDKIAPLILVKSSLPLPISGGEAEVLKTESSRCLRQKLKFQRQNGTTKPAD